MGNGENYRTTLCQQLQGDQNLCLKVNILISTTNQPGVHFFDSLWLFCLVLILSWFFCLSRPIPRLLLKIIFKRDQDQDMSWNKILNETNTKIGLDFKILSRPRPIFGLDSPSLEFRDQYQESRWTLNQSAWRLL